MRNPTRLTEAEIECVAAAMDRAMLDWKAANGGDDASCVDMPVGELAAAAIHALDQFRAALASAGE